MSAEQYAPINASANGDNVIVAAPAAGLKIRVISYMLIANGTVNATWYSDLQATGTALSGALPLAAQAGASCAPGPITPAGQSAWLEAAAAKALNLFLSAGVQVSGHLSYKLERV